VKYTAEIRSRITGDSSMSVNARNVKIVTSQGKVTLRGPVDSAAEKDAIERIARDVAGEGNVDNQIEVVNR
jgi:osmotically-inducible protein OsmY